MLVLLVTATWPNNEGATGECLDIPSSLSRHFYPTIITIPSKCLLITKVRRISSSTIYKSH